MRLLAVGRLVPQKRFDRFLRLLARLSNVSGLRVSGTVVGSGPLEAALRRQAVALQLSSGTIEFRPATPEMYEIYRAADLLVLCSDFEGTPNVILKRWLPDCRSWRWQ